MKGFKADIAKNKDDPQRSYRDLLFEKNEMHYRTEQLRNAGPKPDEARKLSSAEVSQNSTVMGERRRGRPVGSYGEKRLALEAKRQRRQQLDDIRNQEIEAKNEAKRKARQAKDDELYDKKTGALKSKKGK